MARSETFCLTLVWAEVGIIGRRDTQGEWVTRTQLSSRTSAGSNHHTEDVQFIKERFRH